MSKDKILGDLQSLIDSGDLNYYDCQNIANTAKTAWLKNKHKNKSKDTTYADFDIGAKSFEKIVNTELTANQALIESAHELGRDEKYLKEVKHRNYLHSGRIIDNFRHTDLVQAIERDDMLDISELSTASRLYLFINTAYIYKRYLEDQRIIHERLQSLEQFTTQQAELNDSLKASIHSMKMDIKTLQEGTAIKEEDPKNKTIMLDSIGIPAKIIAEEIGKSVRTVYRWLNENKGEEQ